MIMERELHYNFINKLVYLQELLTLTFVSVVEHTRSQVVKYRALTSVVAALLCHSNVLVVHLEAIVGPVGVIEGEDFGGHT